MIKNHLKIAIRNFFKHKGFSFINIFGLAVGVACCILILLFVWDEISYDKYHQKAENIYRTGIYGVLNGNEFKGVVTCSPMAKTLVEEYPEVTASTRIRNFGFPVFRYEDKVFSEEKVFWVDPTFFDVFTVKFIQGDPETALVKPKTILLTQSMAVKYFGAADPMGQVLNADNRRDYQITGVIEDPPHNTHCHYDFLASIETYPDSSSPVWISNNYHTYFVLREGTDPRTFEAKLSELVKNHVGPQIQAATGLSLDEFFTAGGQYSYFIQPMTDIHLRSHLEFELEANGDISNVYIFFIIALGILIVAGINFVNLATARSSTRAREVGVRKTLGSDRGQLIRQFLSETVFLAFLAVLLAMIFVQLSLPVFNNLTGKDIAVPYLTNPLTIPLLLGLVLLVGLTAGLYPAFYLASFDPVAVLKSDLPGGNKKSALRNILVVFQFTVSIFLIIGTLVVNGQMNYIQNKNLGFNKEHVVIIKKTDDLSEGLPAFKQEILAHSNVRAATNTNNLPGQTFGNSAFMLPGMSGEETHLIWTFYSDPDFVKTYEIEMAAGRFFETERLADAQAVVINESAAKELGFVDPVGKNLIAAGSNPEDRETLTIIGVMKDFNFESLHTEIRPLIVGVFSPNNRGRYVSVRVNPENISETLGFLEKTWKKFALNQAFEYEFFDDYFARTYEAEQKTGTLLLDFSVLAIIIACLGLFGLASFVTDQRTKEIGIRKVLGASVPKIVILLSKQFTKWVLLGNIVAWPLAYYIMAGWLRRFDYRAELSIWPFFGAAFAILIIAMVTVSFRTVRAATANPVNAFKYE